jgi:hypothetical protein
VTRIFAAVAPVPSPWLDRWGSIVLLLPFVAGSVLPAALAFFHP